ncbi:imidazole glycerol phosphate synthase subunit HisH [Segetibacter sp.]|uniref:imidazole glycerol phosphate synthase subunit HisH n=1 Tax=Segetibacter sp. TaxID=2231182 RepID=UPI0026283503|nr:imidazole glycerol phosphate synthase subunit HisH [Segetibacter sp.]MCW3080750.1 imidazole glycerol phosphate synthase subunit HisH [Segetibacter sp.]
MVLKIVKYNAGNIQSVLFALERIGVEAEVTDDVEELQTADKVIFPGVGEASTAMEYLKARKLDQVIKELKQPVLGVCLGMQLMCAYSEENDTTCLGIFEEQVLRFESNGSQLKVPQMGWNTIYDLKSPLMKNVREDSYCYFVHSYYASLGEHTIATTDYTKPFSAALNKGNFYGVQFHTEKSADVGEQILKNFIEIQPKP